MVEYTINIKKKKALFQYTLRISNNFSKKSNVIATNYFTTFLQTGDMTDFLLVFI